jgi:hypothetical protein
MSGDGFRVDPQLLGQAASVLDGCGRELASALQGLQAMVTADNPWGADEPGTVFGAAYAAVLGHALGVYASHVEQLGQAAGSLSTWAGTVVEVDSGQAEAFDALAALTAEAGAGPTWG